MVGWLGLWALLGCHARLPAAADARLDRAVSESSGLARSDRQPGLFWTHDDSGGEAALFAVSATGELRGRVQVEGAAAVDWEDLTSDGQGHLWIADAGNNSNTRRDLTLYRVPEPDPGAGSVAVDQRVSFSYPEQTDWPMKDRMNFDSEALFFADGTAWLLTKHRSDLDTVLYRFPALQGTVALERVSSFTLGGDPTRFGGQATAADLSPDGRYLAVLSYHAIFVFERPTEGSDWLSRLAARVDLDQDVAGQCEGLAWDGSALRFTNEDGAMFRVADPLAVPGGRFPPAPHAGQ